MNWDFQTKIGKAQAREQLPLLVESVQNGGDPVAITDYGKTVAVILGISEYTFLLSLLSKDLAKKPGKPICRISGDLELFSKELSDVIVSSVERTANEL